MNAHDASQLDPLIEEVRQRRQALFTRHGNSLRNLYRTIQEAQAKHPEKVTDGPRRHRVLTDEG